MTTYMDIEEFMDVLEGVPNRNEVNQKPNYELLLHSISGLEKSTVNDKVVVSQDLTADLFSNMSDSEMISHFIPMRGIDYDQSYYSDDDLKKKEGDEVEGDVLIADEFLPYRVMPQLNPVYQVNSAFKPVIPSCRKKESGQSQGQGEVIKRESNDSHHLTPTNEVNKEDDRKSPDLLTSNNHNHQSADNTSFSTIKEHFLIKSDSSEVNKTNPKRRDIKNLLKQKQLDDAERSESCEARQIKKRKPRTYRYNPKPLQHKVCRSFVPDDLKDIEYWERRKRNNEAAKKSREERRKKELEIMNSYEMMKQEYSQIKVENIRLKARNAVLEKQIEDLQRKK